MGRHPPLWAAAFKKASPARGGGCAAGTDGGVRRPCRGFTPAGCLRCAPGATPASARAVCAADRQRDNASIVPYACKGLPAFAGYLCRRAAMHPSVGWRRQLPLQGRLWNTGAKKPSLQGEVDAPQARTEGCGTLPGLYVCGMFALRAPGATPASTRAVCAADRQRDDASIVPYACKVRPCRGLWDISAAGRRCPPQSAGAYSSPCRGAFGKPP